MQVEKAFHAAHVALIDAAAKGSDAATGRLATFPTSLPDDARELERVAVTQLGMKPLMDGVPICSFDKHVEVKVSDWQAGVEDELDGEKSGDGDDASTSSRKKSKKKAGAGGKQFVIVPPAQRDAVILIDGDTDAAQCSGAIMSQLQSIARRINTTTKARVLPGMLPPSVNEIGEKGGPQLALGLDDDIIVGVVTRVLSAEESEEHAAAVESAPQHLLRPFDWDGRAESVRLDHERALRAHMRMGDDAEAPPEEGDRWRGARGMNSSLSRGDALGPDERGHSGGNMEGGAPGATSSPRWLLSAGNGGQRWSPTERERPLMGSVAGGGAAAAAALMRSTMTARSLLGHLSNMEAPPSGGIHARHFSSRVLARETSMDVLTRGRSILKGSVGARMRLQVTVPPAVRPGPAALVRWFSVKKFREDGRDFIACTVVRKHREMLDDELKLIKENRLWLRRDESRRRKLDREAAASERRQQRLEERKKREQEQAAAKQDDEDGRRRRQRRKRRRKRRRHRRHRRGSDDESRRGESDKDDGDSDVAVEDKDRTLDAIMSDGDDVGGPVSDASEEEPDTDVEEIEREPLTDAELMKLLPPPVDELCSQRGLARVHGALLHKPVARIGYGPSAPQLCRKLRRRFLRSVGLLGMEH